MSQETPFVIVEHSDVKEFIDQITKQARETLTIYEMISHQNVEKGLSLFDIAVGLVEELAKAEVEVFTNERIDAKGLITMKLPITSPLIRIYRALTIASIMSGEGIPPEMTYIDEVVTMTVTTLLHSQEAVKRMRAAEETKEDDSLGGKSPIAAAVAAKA